MNEAIIEKAVNTLKDGELVITPTESVYGLVADPLNPDAIAKVYKIKQRSPDLALSIHLADPAEIKNWVDHIPAAAKPLIEQYMPGPLTLILPKASHVPTSITGGKNTIGVRCPDHPIAQALIRGVGHGLIMTSANISGEKSPITANEAREQLGTQVDIILDDGPCQHGIASTIIDATVEPMKVLRQGSIQLGNQ
jgi:L-threonylcarbamoyladenylate synthase